MNDECPLLIVFTDELGSTSKSAELYGKKLNEELSTEEYKKTLVKTTCDLFTKQIRGLEQSSTGDWTVIKTIGDSLLIKFAHKSGVFSDSLNECLCSLFKVWTEFEGKIRVACHLTDFECVVTGQDDLKCLKEGLALQEKEGVGVGHVVRSIDEDIFGFPINKAARLAHIPESGLFVVSNEVMEKITDKRNLQSHISDKTPHIFTLGFGTTTKKVQAFPVPVVNAKGVKPSIVTKNNLTEESLEEYYSERELEELETYLDPWFVWEIEPMPDMPMSEEPPKSLRVQLKELQTLKIVAGDFSQDHNVFEKKVCEVFTSILSLNPCKFFVDFVFEVNGQYQLCISDILRKFKLRKTVEEDSRYLLEDGWFDVRAEAKSERGLIPYYVMFISTPDIKVNRMLRSYFTPKEKSGGKKKWSIEHISYDIYGNLYIKKPKLLVNKEGVNNNYFLLLFQIRREYLEHATNLNEFFETSNQPIQDEYKLNNGNDCYCCAYGLIRGEFDGFLLFCSEGNQQQDLNALKKLITEEVQFQKTFYHKISPIFLYDLKLISPSSHK